MIDIDRLAWDVDISDQRVTLAYAIQQLPVEFQSVDCWYHFSSSMGNTVKLLMPILGETGCRLAEIVGLRVEDVDLEDEVLHIRPNDKRRLKTTGSERSLPLVGHALEAIRLVMCKSFDEECVFPQYIKDDGCYATHASNALAKWTKRRWGMTGHSLRHTFRDRPRAAEVPLEAVDQLGGWSSVSNIGSRYGQGYSLKHLRQFIDSIQLK